MAPNTRPPHRSPTATDADRPGPRPEDERLNRRMADALRKEAEARDARGRASSSEDERANARLRADLRDLMDGRES